MAEDAFRVPSGSQSRRARVAAWTSTPEGRLAAVLLAAAAAWTLLILASPRFSFSFRWPRARLPIETAGLVVAGLAAALAYLRYTLDGARASLLVAVAFLALAANRLVFGVVLGPSSLGSQDAVYAWTAGRLAAGILLLAAALPGSQVPTTRARPLLDLARRTSACVLLIHHERKGAAEQAPTGETIRGGSALLGLVDQALLLRPGAAANERVLATVGRYSETPRRLRLRLVGDGFERVEGEPPSRGRPDRDAQVCAALSEAPQTVEELAQRTGLSERQVRAALEQLGPAVVREGAGVRGAPHTYRRAVGAAEPGERPSALPRAQGAAQGSAQGDGLRPGSPEGQP